MFSNYNKRTPIYEFFWQVDLDLLSAKYKFRSIEHLINPVSAQTVWCFTNAATNSWLLHAKRACVELCGSGTC